MLKRNPLSDSVISQPLAETGSTFSTRLSGKELTYLPEVTHGGAGRRQDGEMGWLRQGTATKPDGRPSVSDNNGALDVLFWGKLGGLCRSATLLTRLV